MVGHRPLKASILVRIQAPQHSRIIGVDFAKILCNSFVFYRGGEMGTGTILLSSVWSNSGHITSHYS